MPFGPETGRLTLEEAIARARALRPLIRAQEAESDARGTYSAELHQAFLDAGFYRLVQPAMFGGHEFGLPDFYRVMVELAQAQPSVAWAVTLPSSHVFVVASHWPEAAQREVFAHGTHALVPWRATPLGKAVPVDGGYRVTGTWSYCSGAPHGTHFIGHALIEGGGSVHCLVPRADYQVLDDWGGARTLGMRASGSNSVRLEDVFVPIHRAVANPGTQFPEDGTPGTRLHGNPMYLGQIAGPFQASLVAIVVGAARAAIDDYAEMVSKRKMQHDPATLMADGPEAARHLGNAIALTDAAEAGLLGAMERYMELCRRWARDGTAFSDEESLRLRGSGQQSGQLAYDAIESLFLAAGSFATRQGNRLQACFRDAQMYRSHSSSQPDEVSAMIGRARLGRPVRWVRRDL